MCVCVVGGAQRQRGAAKASVKRQGGPRTCFYPNRTWGLRGLEFQGGPRVGEAPELTWCGGTLFQKKIFKQILQT